MHKILVLIFILVLPFVSSTQASETRKITLGEKTLNLIGQPLQVGKPLPNLSLPNLSLEMVNLQSFRGKVTLLSVVPSLDTSTCEKQTHILSEENGSLDATLVTISRDLPFAQKRFSKNAKIENLVFLSDYRDAGFGQSTGLLIKENRLLTRAIIVLDQEGVVRYLEIVPNLGQLPKMQMAFDLAQSLIMEK
ncbi:MAG: thiol peroxidase [Nitrospinota bacterium]|nr:thiol peroxidase [Nitrospinota bacterium]